MSLKEISAVFDLAIPAGPKLVLLALIDRADREHRCYPGQGDLARRVSSSVRSVRSHLLWLEDAGFIIRTERRRKDGYRTSDEYRIETAVISSAKFAGEIPLDPGVTRTISAAEFSPEIFSPQEFSPAKSVDSHRQNLPLNITTNVVIEPPQYEQGSYSPDHSESLAPNNLFADDPVRDAFDLYNKTAERVGLSKARDLTRERRAKIRTRLSRCGGIEGWKAALAKLEVTTFCHGQNDRGWIADLDFLLSHRSFTRLTEGYYDTRKGINGRKSDYFSGVMEAGRNAARNVGEI